MNTYHHQRAAKLKSLSLEPVVISAPPTRRRGKFFLGAGLVIALSAALGITMIRPIMWEGGMPSLASQSDANVAQSSTTGEALVAAQRPTQIPMAKTITGSGHVAAPVSAALFSRQTARVASIHADIGDRVAAGQVVIRLQDADTQFSLEAASNSRAAAETALAVAIFEAEQNASKADRALRLLANHTMAESTVDEAIAARERARFGVATARRSLEAARLMQAKAQSALDDLTMTAPVSGVVVERRAQPDQLALSLTDAGDTTSSLMTIVDISQLVIDIDISETSLAAIQVGMTGEAILDAYPDHPFQVTVIRLSPAASFERGTVGIRLSIQSPPDGIRPNLAVRVSLSSVSPPSRETTEKGSEP